MPSWTCPPFWDWPTLELDRPDRNCKVQEVVPGPFCSPRLPNFETVRHGIPDPFSGVLGPKVEVLGPDGPCYIHCHLTEALWNEWRLSLVQGIPDPFKPGPRCICIKGRRRIRPRICARKRKHQAIDKLGQLDGAKQVRDRVLDKFDQSKGTQRLKDQVANKSGQLKGIEQVKDQAADKLGQSEGTKRVKDRAVGKSGQLEGTQKLKGQVADKLGQLDKARQAKDQVLGKLSQSDKTKQLKGQVVDKLGQLKGTRQFKNQDKLGQLDGTRQVKDQVLDELGQLEQTKRLKGQPGQLKARVSDKLGQLDKPAEDEIRSALKGPKQRRKMVDGDKEADVEGPRSARFKRRTLNDAGTDPRSAGSPRKVRSGHVTEGTEKKGPIGFGPCLKGPYYLVPAQDLVLDEGRVWQWAQRDGAQTDKVQKDEDRTDQVQEVKGPMCKAQKGKGQKCAVQMCKAQKDKGQNLYTRAKRRIRWCFRPRQDRRTKDQAPCQAEGVGVVCCRCDCPYLKVKGQGRNVRGQTVEGARDESRTSGARGPGSCDEGRSKGKSLRFASRSGYDQGQERSRTFTSQEDPDGEDLGCAWHCGVPGGFVRRGEDSGGFRCKGNPREFPRCSGDAGGLIRCRKVPGGFLRCKKFPRESPGCREGAGEFLRCRKVPGGFLACKKVPGETPRGFPRCKEETRKIDSDSGERADVSDSSEDFCLIGNNNNRNNDNDRSNKDDKCNNCSNCSNNKSNDRSHNNSNNSRRSQKSNTRNNNNSSNKNANNNSTISNNDDNRNKDIDNSISSSNHKSGGSNKSTRNNSNKSKINSIGKNNSKYNGPRVYSSRSEKEDGGLDAGSSPIKRKNNGSSWLKANQNEKILEETFLSERQDSSSECEFLCSISESEMEVLRPQNGGLMATQQDGGPMVPTFERQLIRLRGSLEDEAKGSLRKDKAKDPFGSKGKAERPLSPKGKAKSPLSPKDGARGLFGPKDGLFGSKDDGKDRFSKNDKAKGPFGSKDDGKDRFLKKDKAKGPFGSKDDEKDRFLKNDKAKGPFGSKDDGIDRFLKKDKAKGPFGPKDEAKDHSGPKDEAWRGSSRSKGTDTSGIRFTPGPCLGLRIGNFTDENYLDEFLDRNRRNNNNNKNNNNSSSIDMNDKKGSISNRNSSDSPCYPARERRRNLQRASTT